MPSAQRQRSSPTSAQRFSTGGRLGSLNQRASGLPPSSVQLNHAIGPDGIGLPFNPTPFFPTRPTGNPFQGRPIQRPGLGGGGGLQQSPISGLLTQGLLGRLPQRGGGLQQILDLQSGNAFGGALGNVNPSLPQFGGQRVRPQRREHHTSNFGNTNPNQSQVGGLARFGVR